jgi:excisionase family DNA binding protein
MNDRSCLIGRRREGRDSADLDRSQDNPARRSRRRDDRRPGDQETSAYGRDAEADLENSVGSDSATHSQAPAIPAWAAQARCEVRQNEIRRDRSIASDRGLASNSITNVVQPLLSVRQSAARLNVSTKTIRRLIARGDLRGVRIGRAIRIQEEEIGRLIAAGSSI